MRHRAKAIPKQTKAFPQLGLLLLSFLAVFIAAIALSSTWVKADPNPSSYEKWKTDFDMRNIELSEVLSGGVIRDQIPAIDKPKFISIEENETLRDLEPVVAFEHNGDARAYPVQILMWHEIVNDTVGGHTFSITFCPLCNAAIVFDGEFEGKKHDFGTTGRLRNSDLIMYDRQTESWWQQFSGEALIGEYTGKKLKIKASRLESWASFKKRFPNGKVLVPNDPSLRAYGRNPYSGYDERQQPYGLYTGTLPEGINAMERVVVLRRDGEPVSVLAMNKIREAGQIEQDGFVLKWSAGQASALGAARIAEGRDVGNLVVSENKDGKMVDAIHDIVFAFVAHAFHPELKIIQ